MNRRKLAAGIGAAVLLTAVALSLFWQGQRAAAQTAAPEAPASIYQTQLSSTHYALNWNVAASGGGTISSTSYQLSSTIGQPTTSVSSGASYEVRSGFWQEFIYKLFLPLIQKP